MNHGLFSPDPLEPRTVADGSSSASYLLVLTGTDWTPDRVTEATAVTPTRVYHEGQPPIGARYPSKVRAWQVRVDRDEPDVAGALDELMATLQPAWSTFVNLGRQLEVWILVRVTARGVAPQFSLDSATLAAIGELGARFDVDFSFEDSASSGTDTELA